jgi:hypothetical protein
MVMENTLQLKNPQNLAFTFDLKGSKVGRIEKNVTEPTTVQKDLNLLK